MRLRNKLLTAIVLVIVICSVAYANIDQLISRAVTITNTTAVTATEKAVVIPAGTKRAFIKCRDATVSWKYAFISTNTATIYVTVPAGGSWSETSLNLDPEDGLTIYVLQASGGSLVFEGEFWK